MSPSRTQTGGSRTSSGHPRPRRGRRLPRHLGRGHGPVLHGRTERKRRRPTLTSVRTTALTGNSPASPRPNGGSLPRLSPTMLSRSLCSQRSGSSGDDWRPSAGTETGRTGPSWSVRPGSSSPSWAARVVTRSSESGDRRRCPAPRCRTTCPVHVGTPQSAALPQRVDEGSHGALSLSTSVQGHATPGVAATRRARPPGTASTHLLRTASVHAASRHVHSSGAPSPPPARRSAAGVDGPGLVNFARDCRLDSQPT